MTDHTVPRDRYGRPMLIPAGGGKRKAYQRISTLAKKLDDSSNLMPWHSAMSLLGVAQDDSLQARLASIASKRSVDPWAEHKGALKEIIESAMSGARSSRAANFGTALHEFLEVSDEGGSTEFAPLGLQGHITAYETLRDSGAFKPVGTEMFLVNDVLGCAGSADRLVEWTGRTVVGDIKTGASDPDFALGVTIQVATYAHSVRYDIAADSERFAGEARDRIYTADEAAELRAPISTSPDYTPDVGVLIHLPFKAVPATCRLYKLDLKMGWEAAQLAKKVETWRRTKAKAA